MEILNCLGYNVFSGRLDEIELTHTNKILNTISPISYGISTKDKDFKRALQSSDILVLDGTSFGLTSIFLHRKKMIMNYGADVFHFFLNKINKKSGRVFFLGASIDTLERMKKNASNDYPFVTIGYHSPPFKDEFSEEDNRIMLEKINAFSPDILYVGMTCPKQEKWSFRNKDKINASLTCNIGAVFDWYAGKKPIAPIWWQLRLGWLKRAIDRPEVLKRYPNIGIYFWHLSLAIIGFKKYRTGNY